MLLHDIQDHLFQFHHVTKPVKNFRVPRSTGLSTGTNSRLFEQNGTVQFILMLVGKAIKIEWVVAENTTILTKPEKGRYSQVA